MSEDHTEYEVQKSEQTRSVAENIKSSSIWRRAFFMIVLAFIWAVARLVVGAVVVVQFFWVLFTGVVNEGLKDFGQQLAIFVFQIVRYLTFNTEERPFPFDLNWPEVTDIANDERVQESTK